METLKKWNKSKKSLTEYLQFPCEIDEDLYNYIGEIVPPEYCYKGIIQLGEAEYSDTYGISYHVTAISVNRKYFYIGILPEFKEY